MAEIMNEELLLTQEGYDKIVKEHEELVSVKRAEVAERLKEAISYGETGNSKTGTIRYAIGCRICRNAGGRKSRGCPSLRRMPRENRRRPGADRIGAKGPRFFGYGARCTVFFEKNGNRCESERLTKTGGSCRNNKKRDAARPAFLFVVLRPAANSS